MRLLLKVAMWQIRYVHFFSRCSKIVLRASLLTILSLENRQFLQGAENTLIILFLRLWDECVCLLFKIVDKLY